jgi:hypothetical protein
MTTQEAWNVRQKNYFHTGGVGSDDGTHGEKRHQTGDSDRDKDLDVVGATFQ